jgi:hypothetical protein
MIPGAPTGGGVAAFAAITTEDVGLPAVLAVLGVLLLVAVLLAAARWGDPRRRARVVSGARSDRVGGPSRATLAAGPWPVWAGRDDARAVLVLMEGGPCHLHWRDRTVRVREGEGVVVGRGGFVGGLAPLEEGTVWLVLAREDSAAARLLREHACRAPGPPWGPGLHQG